MKVAERPTVADDAEGFAAVDALEPQFCCFCTTALVDPDLAPYCSRICAIEAEND